MKARNLVAILALTIGSYSCHKADKIDAPIPVHKGIVNERYTHSRYGNNASSQMLLMVNCNNKKELVDVWYSTNPEDTVLLQNAIRNNDSIEYRAIPVGKDYLNTTFDNIKITPFKN